MKKLIYSLVLLMAVCVYSCKKDTPIVVPVIDPQIAIQVDGGTADKTLTLPQEGSLKLEVIVENSTDFKVTWSDNGKQISTEAVYEFIATELGDHTISVLVVNHDGGKTSAEITINVHGKYKYGTFILNEGNMTTENGFLSFISPSGEITDSVYYKENGNSLGNVCQDLYIANNSIYIVCQNGESMGGEGSFIIADAQTLKKRVAYGSEYFRENSLPAHVAVIGDNVFIQGNSGITLFNEKTATFTLIPETKGAAKNNMAVVGDKLFASAGNSMMVLSIKNGEVSVDNIACPGRVGGIIKSDDNNVWLACGGSPSTISKINATTLDFMEQHTISEVALGLSRRTSPTICAKADTIYMKAEGDRATEIWRHIFSKNETRLMVDVKTQIENGKQGYNAINVDPKTGYVYVNTMKGYGWDFLYNNTTIWNFAGNTPILVNDYQNHTHFPAGVYFTDSFKR